MALGDFKERLRATFTRRASLNVSLPSTDGEVPQLPQSPKSARSLTSRISLNRSSSIFGASRRGSRTENFPRSSKSDDGQETSARELKLSHRDLQRAVQLKATTHLDSSTQTHDFLPTNPATPLSDSEIEVIDERQDDRDGDFSNDEVAKRPPASSPSILPSADLRPLAASRRQSLLPQQETTLIKSLLDQEATSPSLGGQLDYLAPNVALTTSGNMVNRKIWVKRPNASATLVSIHEDDLVDDVRDMILKKYANSLGRNFDAPDVTLRIIPREQRQERTLGPEESMARVLDVYFPGGQTVDEALIIDVPLRRTPRASPRGGPLGAYYHDDGRPGEGGSDYFPPMPVPTIPSPNLPHSVPVAAVNGAITSHHSASTSHAMSVLTTGHVPNLPSPGGSRRHYNRPRIGRTHTSSPTAITAGHTQTPTTVGNGTIVHPRGPRSRTHSSASEKSNAPPAAPPLPTPPTSDATTIQRTSTPPPRVSSPRIGTRPKKSKKINDHPSLPAGLLNGAVPPINVLIVEDNIINLKLLEAFMKRLKVRWQTAMNGKEAVTKWRTGGFHLVLMDIQLPVMNGLEATREIRRLEKVNSIGVFSSSASSSAPETTDEPEGEDKLPNLVLFKSPVIIVALTASSLQSDRHEALAAGCNDFLTKPVNFVWLERKVMEWGCMQALIDFDGWRKWKDFSQSTEESETGSKKSGGLLSKSKPKKNRMSLGGSNGVNVTKSIKEEEEVKA